LADSLQCIDYTEHALGILAAVGFQRFSYRLFPGCLHIAERHFAEPQARGLAIGDFESRVAFSRQYGQDSLQRRAPVLARVIIMKVLEWGIKVNRSRGASVIQCCYAAVERRDFSALANTAASKNAKVTFRSPKKSIVEEKISLNVSRLVANPACIAGVRTWRPNLRAM
jgi:hypothetical protein